MGEGKIVAICQYGGEFVTNSDGSLSYSGGEAHAIDVGPDMLFDEFNSEISTLFNIDITSMSIKYFLPSNKKTLITISSDKDLRRMVHFNENATTSEVYILNKVDHRTTRSIVADSGTSIVASGVQNKRKRPQGGARATKNKSRASESGTLNAVTNLIVDNANPIRQSPLTIYENNRQIRPITTAQNIGDRYLSPRPFWLVQMFVEITDDGLVILRTVVESLKGYMII